MHKWEHEIRLLLHKQMHIAHRGVRLPQAWFALTDKSNFLFTQSSQIVGLNSCPCIQGSESFPSLMHSSDFHWNRLLHCRFSMNINFSDLTCCFRTQFHSTVDFHMCCNVCVSKQCLGNHIRIAERRKRKACFLIFFFWQSQLETQSKKRSSNFPRRNVAHRANVLLKQTKNVLVACVYFRKKKQNKTQHFTGIRLAEKKYQFTDMWEA